MARSLTSTNVKAVEAPELVRWEHRKTIRALKCSAGSDTARVSTERNPRKLVDIGFMDIDR